MGWINKKCYEYDTCAHLPLCTKQRWTWQCKKMRSEAPVNVNILKEKRLVVSLPFCRTSTVPSSGLGHLEKEEMSCKKHFTKPSSAQTTGLIQISKQNGISSLFYLVFCQLCMRIDFLKIWFPWKYMCHPYATINTILTDHNFAD